MKLNLKNKKDIDDKVLRTIIQYGLGFASRVKNLEERCIDDWESDKLYDKSSFVIYDGYIWKAKVTNQSSTWDEKYWTKLTDELSLIELDDIKAMLNLTDEQLKTLQSLILDSSIELSHVWSSSKTYGEIQNAIKKGEAFTLQELAKKTGASYKIVTNITDVTSTEYLYLLANANNAYDIYALIDGTAQKIGDTTIDLSQFYTKTEIDNDFLKKTDADSKFATITTVDGKVDKTSILSTISSTPSDDKLLSEKAIKSELDKLKTNFRDGVDTVYDAVVAKGTTPVDKSPSEIADAISKMGGDLTSIYNALSTKGLPMSGTESDDQIASIITDLMTIKSFTSKTDSTTFVFNGTKDTIKDTELVDTSSGLKLEFSTEELASVESGGYIEFAEIDKAEYNNRLKFV